MTILPVFQKRRSCRNYKDTLVSREVLDECFHAVRLAPSACNLQPFRFIVIDEPNLRKEVSERIFSGPFKMNDFAKKAPVLVVAIRKRNKLFAQVGAWFRKTEYNLIDLSIAVEHFVLQAEQLGLSTCWIGWFNEKELRKILKIEKDEKIDVVISAGYFLDENYPEIKRKPIEEIVTYNS